MENLGLDINCEFKDEYLFVELLPIHLNMDDSKKAFLNVVNEAKKQGMNKILVDTRKITSNLNTTQRYIIGKFIAKESIGINKIGILALEEQIDQRILENVASNRGADVFVSTSEEKAIKWLLK